MKASSQLGAAGLAFAGYTLWVLTDTCLKLTGREQIPPAEVIAGVGLAMMLALGVYAGLRGRLGVLRPVFPGRQAARSMLDVANNFCVVIALRHLPLALFYILVFCAPSVTTLFAALALGERLTWRRGFAVLLGFAGVVVAVNPLGLGRVGDWTGYGACAVCVLAFSANMVWSRAMTKTETWESMTFFSGAMSALVGSLALPGHGQTPSLTMAALLGGAGLFGVVGCFCFFTALSRVSASIVSQFHYTQLLTGAVVGFLVWRERVTGAMLLGAGLIVIAGIYTAVGRASAGVPVEEAFLAGEVEDERAGKG